MRVGAVHVSKRLLAVTVVGAVVLLGAIAILGVVTSAPSPEAVRLQKVPDAVEPCGVDGDRRRPQLRGHRGVRRQRDGLTGRLRSRGALRPSDGEEPRHDRRRRRPSDVGYLG